jgi:prepilin-type N-terminal cleavage/methylation domain-containing protein
MRSRYSASGFTVIEVLIAMAVFSTVAVAMYQVLFSARYGSQRSTDIVRSSEEARLGFNRLVRDTREGRGIKAPSDTSFTVEIDFNGNGTIEPTPADPLGSYEVITYTFIPSASGAGTITATAGGVTEVLMAGVDCVRKADNTCYPVFTYRSSRLEYDANGDGVTSWQELDTAESVGNKNGLLDGVELGLVDIVAFALRVTQGDTTETFYAEAQLRNQR